MGKTKKIRPSEDVTEQVEELAEDEVDAPRAKKKKKARKAEQQEDEPEAPPPKPKKSKRSAQAEDAEDPEAPPVVARRKKGGEQALEAPSADAAGEEPPAKRKKEKKQKGGEQALEAPSADATGEEPPAKKKKKGRRRDSAGDAAEGGQEESSRPVDDDRPPKEKRKRRSEDAAEEANPTLEPLTVFVGGIPWSCNAEILRRDFGECGEVTDVNLLMDRVTGKSRGIAYVTFADDAGVEAALKYDGDDYGGRALKVVRAEASAVRESKIASGAYEVFVRGLPADTSEDSLRTRFSSCGTIGRLNLPTRGSGKCKGFAWLTFASKADMDKALKLNGAECGSAKLLVEAAGEHKAAGSGAAKGKGKGKGKVSTEREVFVSNLPYEAQEADLRKDFSECGEIERMHMPMRNSKSMGFAWITFTTEDSMDKALSYNGDDYGGRRLRVEKSGQHKAAAGKGKGDGKGTDD